MKLVTLSSKNQITIPQSMLTQLTMSDQRKLVIERHPSGLILKPLTQSVVDQTAGSLTAYVPKTKLHKSWRSIAMKTKKETAKKLATKL